MSSIVLFYPKTGVDEISRVPSSVLAIASPLIEAGFKVEIIDARVERYYSQRLLASLDDALCVGISSMTGYQVHSGLEAARLVREKDPEVPIVWGGFHPTLLPSQTTAHHLVDIIVKGQGEITMVELVKRMAKGSTLREVKGICYKENGKIVENPDRKWEDINNFPPLAFNLIQVENYVLHDVSPRTLDYISSRGCPHRCSFCAISRFYGRRWNGLKPNRVLDELQSLVTRYKINGIRFIDDNFFVDKERVSQICKGISERGLEIKWNASCRCDYFSLYDEDLLNLMKRSGCHTIEFGVESGSQRVLNLIKKDITVEEILRSAEMCQYLGFKGAYSFMMGFPSEKREDLDQTLDLMDRIREIHPESEMNMFIYTPFPGTPLFDLAIKYGLKIPESLEGWGKFSHNTVVIPWIDKGQRSLFEELSYLSWFAFTPSFENRMKKGYLKFAAKILRRLALFRWRHRFFKFPVEWELVKRTRPWYKL